MTRETIARALSLTAIISTIVFMTASLAGTSTGYQEKTAEQVYKNIESFKGMPASHLDGAMSFMSASLGVGCDYCHTDSWESDARAAKQNARRMIEMTQKINKENYGVNWGVVNCYTCHKGRPHPESIPDAEQPAWQPPDAKAATASLPALNEVLDKYIQAIGGKEAIEKLNTRISKGSLTTTNLMTPPVTAPLEVYQKAPNRLLTVAAYPDGAFQEGHDGSTAWASDKRKQRDIIGEEARQKLDEDFYGYLKIRERYPTMRLMGTEPVGDREAYVVGATSRDGSRDRLYFDAQTGLLIRKHTIYKTVFGTIPEVVDFRDYREVDGVKLPFTTVWSRLPFTVTRKLTEIKHNLPIDDAKFKNPFARR